MNWRDKSEIMVGWVDRPELNGLMCEVTERWHDGEYSRPLSASWAHGKSNRVVWCHSQQRYVWL